jgi:serine/threonine protein kinase
MSAKLFDTRSLGRQFVDRYELMGEIASGGMASVYLARVTGVGGFQRLFALKRLHPHLQGEKEFVQMFIDEARLAAGIHHPNVVPILEVGTSPHAGYYLVMEYIEGETFARLLARASSQRERVPEGIVVRVVLDMLHGLHAAHELRDEAGGPAGVVHRDVSPQNLLVGIDGIGRITDFGVARAASRLNATRAGQLKGKIAYMAPEQAMGSDNLDRRADVFAAAVVLWEGLAHKRLFKAETEAATLARVIAEAIPPLSVAAPRVPPQVADVVMRALDRDLTRRFSTCSEFADALEHAAQEVGFLSTSRELQAYLGRMLGTELAVQEQELRQWSLVAETIQANVATNLTPSFGRISAIATENSGTLFREPSLSRRGVWERALLSAAVVALAAGGFVVYKALDRVSETKARAGSPSVTILDAPEPSRSGSPVVEEPHLAFDPKTGRLDGGAPREKAGEPVAPASAPVSEPSRAVAPAAPARKPEPSKAKPASKGPSQSSDSLLDSNPYR